MNRHNFNETFSRFDRGISFILSALLLFNGFFKALEGIPEALSDKTVGCSLGEKRRPRK